MIIANGIDKVKNQASAFNQMMDASLSSFSFPGGCFLGVQNKRTLTVSSLPLSLSNKFRGIQHVQKAYVFLV